MPNLLLQAPDGRPVRLYQLLGYDAALLAVSNGTTAARPAADLPANVKVLPIGGDGYRDPAGMAQRLLAGHDGWILVRPDAHVAWAWRQPADLAAGVRHALGLTAAPTPTSD